MDELLVYPVKKNLVHGKGSPWSTEEMFRGAGVAFRAQACVWHRVSTLQRPLVSGCVFWKLVASLAFFIFNFRLCWVFASVRGLSPAAASRGHSSSWCAGLSLSRPLLLRSMGSRRAGSAAVAHGPSRPAAGGIFPDQG